MGNTYLHGSFRIRGSFVFLLDEFPEFSGGKASSPKALNGTPVTIHHYVEDCDAAIKRAADAGATILMPAQGHVLGRRLAHGRVHDPAPVGRRYAVNFLGADAVTVLVSWRQLLQPWADPGNHLFIAGVPVLGGLIALFLLRHWDRPALTSASERGP